MKNQFGRIIKFKRENMQPKMTAKSLAKHLNITPAYLCDIEKGKRYPPKNMLDKIVEVLSITGEAKDNFYDVAALETYQSNNVSLDISEYIMCNESLRKLIRISKLNNLDNSFWCELVNKFESEEKKYV